MMAVDISTLEKLRNKCYEKLYEAVLVVSCDKYGDDHRIQYYEPLFESRTIIYCCVTRAHNNQDTVHRSYLKRIYSATTFIFFFQQN